jgi:hypothetical protein
MPEFIQKPVRYTANQFDGTTLLPGMTFDMGGAFIVNTHGQLIYLDKGDWIVVDNFNVTSVYSDFEFQKRFAPAE